MKEFEIGEKFEEVVNCKKVIFQPIESEDFCYCESCVYLSQLGCRKPKMVCEGIDRKDHKDVHFEKV